jgi:hypothetical protein
MKAPLLSAEYAEYVFLKDTERFFKLEVRGFGGAYQVFL